MCRKMLLDSDDNAMIHIRFLCYAHDFDSAIQQNFWLKYVRLYLCASCFQRKPISTSKIATTRMRMGSFSDDGMKQKLLRLS